MTHRHKSTLTPADLQFVEKYVETLSPEEAYRACRPGYEGKNASKNGYEKLQRPSIRAAIETRRMQVSAELDVTSTEVIRRMMYIGYCDPKDFTDQDGHWLGIRQIPREARLAISKIKVRKEDVEVECATTKDGKVTIETTTTTRFKILEYGMWDKVKMLNSLAEHLNLFGGGRPKSAIEDLSIEELERLTKANEEAVRAIDAVSEKSRRTVLKAAQKTAASVMAEPVKAPGNGKTKGNGKGNGSDNGKVKP